MTEQTKTIMLPGGATVTTEARKAERLMRKLKALKLMTPNNNEYNYEFVNGTIGTGTFVGWQKLNLRFRRKDGTDFLVPVVDMGDGSLCTEYISRS